MRFYNLPSDLHTFSLLPNPPSHQGRLSLIHEHQFLPQFNILPLHLHLQVQHFRSLLLATRMFCHLYTLPLLHILQLTIIQFRYLCLHLLCLHILSLHHHMISRILKQFPRRLSLLPQYQPLLQPRVIPIYWCLLHQVNSYRLHSGSGQGGLWGASLSFLKVTCFMRGRGQLCQM